MKIANVVYNSLLNLKATIPNTIKLSNVDYTSTEIEVITIKSESASSVSLIDNNQRVVIMNDDIIPIAKIIK